jgi:hypothetical protein
MLLFKKWLTLIEGLERVEQEHGFGSGSLEEHGNKVLIIKNVLNRGNQLVIVGSLYNKDIPDRDKQALQKYRMISNDPNMSKPEREQAWELYSSRMRNVKGWRETRVMYPVDQNNIKIGPNVANPGDNSGKHVITFTSNNNRFMGLANAQTANAINKVKTRISPSPILAKVG